MNKSVLYRQIQGALKCTIAAHNHIHRKSVSSATKRIIGNLKRFQTISIPDEPLKEAIMIFMAEEHRKLRNLQVNLENPLTKNSRKGNIAGKISSIRASLRHLDNILNNNFHKYAKPIGDTQL